MNGTQGDLNALANKLITGTSFCDHCFGMPKAILTPSGVENVLGFIMRITRLSGGVSVLRENTAPNTDAVILCFRIENHMQWTLELLTGVSFYLEISQQ